MPKSEAVTTTADSVTLAVAGGGDVVRKPVTTNTTTATVTSAVPTRRSPVSDRPAAGTWR